MNNPENLRINNETINEIESVNIEKAEKPSFLSPEKKREKAESARSEVLKTAIKIETEGKIKEKEQRLRNTQRPNTISKKQKNESYKRTLSRVQAELPITERVFSKIIHNEVVDKVSDITGKTIARPNSILYGAFFAFIITLIAYYVAKTIGYQLSGSETILAFSVGWLLGIIVDYLKNLFSTKNR